MDLFVVPTIGFRLLYGFCHRADSSQRSRMDQRHSQPEQRSGLHARSPRHFPCNGAPRYMIPGPRSDLRRHCHTADFAPWASEISQLHRPSPWQNGFGRTDYRIDPARVLGPRYCFRARANLRRILKIIRRLLQLRQKRIGLCTRMRRFLVRLIQAGMISFTPSPRRASPSLRFGFEFSVHTGHHHFIDRKPSSPRVEGKQGCGLSANRCCRPSPWNKKSRG